MTFETGRDEKGNRTWQVTTDVPCRVSILSDQELGVIVAVDDDNGECISLRIAHEAMSAYPAHVEVMTADIAGRPGIGHLTDEDAHLFEEAVA